MRKKHLCTGLTKLCTTGARYFGNRHFTYTSTKGNPLTQRRLSPTTSQPHSRTLGKRLRWFINDSLKHWLGGGGEPFKKVKGLETARRPTRATLSLPHARSDQDSRIPHRAGPPRPLRRPRGTGSGNRGRAAGARPGRRRVEGRAPGGDNAGQRLPRRLPLIRGPARRHHPRAAAARRALPATLPRLCPTHFLYPLQRHGSAGRAAAAGSAAGGGRSGRVTASARTAVGGGRRGRGGG